jgi:hypothetical protein
MIGCHTVMTVRKKKKILYTFHWLTLVVFQLAHKMKKWCHMAICKFKNGAIRQFVNDNKIDVTLWTETDKHWQSLAFKDRLPTRTAGWFESLHMTTAYYKSYPGATKQQYGGVSLWSTSQAAHHIKDSGIDLAARADSFGLGRWAWTQYQGRNEVSLRVVVAYRPVLNKCGPMSVWQGTQVD